MSLADPAVRISGKISKFFRSELLKIKIVRKDFPSRTVFLIPIKERRKNRKFRKFPHSESAEKLSPKTGSE